MKYLPIWILTAAVASIAVGVGMIFTLPYGLIALGGGGVIIAAILERYA